LSRAGRPLRGSAAIALVLIALGVGTQGALASGSANLWPNAAPGNRANTEWRTSSYGGGTLIRRTLVKAFMNAGEQLMLGSSAVGQGSSDILVYNPGLVTGPIGTETVPAPGSASFSCNAQRTAGGAPPNQGMITSRAEELAGPDTIPTGGVVNAYVPCHYAAPSTGVYDIVFLGPAGFALSPDADGTIGGDVALAQATDFSAAQGTSVAAWDATVRANLTDTAAITGRVFTYYLALFTGGNGLPVYPSIYPVTKDGFRYQVDLRGMDPNGWLVYGNQVGFLDSDGATPLYHDAVAAAAGSPGQLTNIQGGVTFALPSFPIFFEPPSAAAIAALGIPATPTAPVMTALAFLGNLGGNTSLVNTGGTFAFTTNMAGVYDIVISRDGVNFDPTLPANRSLRGVRAAGANTASWNGQDNVGTPFPVGTYSVHASFHGGEYHFPMIDVENDTQGGPVITLLNPPGGVCPPLTGGCHSSFYDDRAYQTLNGTVVNAGNTVGTVLCGVAPPATANSDPILGFDSSTTQRAYGTGTDGNTNAPCTGNFGDAKGLDIWTYDPSNSVLAPLNIVAAAADIGVTKTVSDPTPPINTDVTFTITATNHGPNDATGVQLTDVLPAELTFVSANPSQGAYNAGTGIWNIGALAVDASVTLQITATVTGTNQITNTATRTASSPVDPNPANDSASASVTATMIPGLPGTGVQPVGASPAGSPWPGVLLVLVWLSAAAAAARRGSYSSGRTSIFRLAASSRSVQILR
jgi:uncharacterized repeat protein (TIGR01451 family)